ncbi:PadR family transcriptional regulator [Oscillochloris sp. ZM17-4]|uniref:helix-turn-helix transcriptional regulator n=1 Tax=Oscillochloris sp. ZM17-4 TaxID=2866714 RepID=UPI001C732196|nr:helix-turn-helix transcriptional regulator [Oscillochloris sp. ZM17-4]MBX0328589.1 PadR family transcriptional regulator [Oscillochloris sp. ZM17-4]
MEERLLILGLLRSHAMHGYQLHEALADRAVTAVHLSKANAYKLLRKLADEGLVTASEEREGARPPRRVYRLTPAGEATFQTVLRTLLAEYAEPEFPAIVPLNFLAELPPAEGLALLRQRRAQLVTRLTSIAHMSEETRLAHLSLDYFHRIYQAELAWLDQVIARLDTTTSEESPR